MFQWGMRQSAELENQMTSVERVLEYGKAPREANLESPIGIYFFLSRLFFVSLTIDTNLFKIFFRVQIRNLLPLGPARVKSYSIRCT